MKLHKLINQLITIKRTHGNLDVFVVDGGSTNQDEVLRATTGTHLDYPGETQAYIDIDSGPHCSECGRGCG